MVSLVGPPPTTTSLSSLCALPTGTSAGGGCVPPIGTSGPMSHGDMAARSVAGRAGRRAPRAVVGRAREMHRAEPRCSFHLWLTTISAVVDWYGGRYRTYRGATGSAGKGKAHSFM